MRMTMLIVLASLMACSTSPETTRLTGEGLDGNYVQYDNSNFDRFVIKDPAAFAQYRKIMLFPIQLDGMLIMPSGDDEINRSWSGVTYEEMLPYVSSFDDLAGHLFAEGKDFELTNTGGDDVLAVEFRLKRYRPEVNRAGSMSAGTAGETAVRSYGVMHMQAVLAHSQTGDLVAVLEDAVTVAPRGFGVTAFGNTTTVDASSTISKANQRGAWRRTLRSWLLHFRSDLGKLHDHAVELAARKE